MFRSVTTKAGKLLGSTLGLVVPSKMLEAALKKLAESKLHLFAQAVGPQLNRQPNLDNMEFDLPVDQDLEFEHLSGLFASTSLNHGVIAMPIRQAAYIYGLVKQLGAKECIEIGRYKGGSTLLIAAAMQGDGQFWSIDNGEKEVRLVDGSAPDRRPYDEQILDMCRRFHVKAQLCNGDSRTIEVDTGEQVDLVLIDGDHSYEGVKNDFERFGRRVRPGGAVLFDDAFDESDRLPTHSDTVGRLVEEITRKGEFKLVKVVNRLAHLERVAA